MESSGMLSFFAQWKAVSSTFWLSWANMLFFFFSLICDNVVREYSAYIARSYIAPGYKLGRITGEEQKKKINHGDLLRGKIQLEELEH